MWFGLVQTRGYCDYVVIAAGLYASWSEYITVHQFTSFLPLQLQSPVLYTACWEEVWWPGNIYGVRVTMPPTLVNRTWVSLILFKLHYEFIAVCIVTSAPLELPMATNE